MSQQLSLRRPASSVLIAHSSADAYGSDRACLETARAATAHGYRVHVIVPYDGPLTRSLARAQIEFSVIDPFVLRRSDLRGGKAVRFVLRLPARLWRLRSFARSHRFDLVHSNCAVTWGGAYLARCWRVPHLWHVHEFLPGGVAGRAFERLLASADAVLTCSASVGESFKLDGLRRSYRVAYTGADVGSNREAGRQPFEASVEMLCVGRLNAWKGQEVLIEAVAELRRRGLDAKLRLVGDVFGGQRHFWNALATQIARLGLAEHVTMLGFRTDVGELMTSADVVVVPSQRPEPFGMVVVEAMALGRCVVATAAGGPSEIIEDGVSGLLVPSGSATAIADAVGRLAADPVLAREVAAAARRRAAGFSHRAMTACILESYAALLARPEPLPAQATARTAERAAAR